MSTSACIIVTILQRRKQRSRKCLAPSRLPGLQSPALESGSAAPQPPADVSPADRPLRQGKAGLSKQ